MADAKKTAHVQLKVRIAEAAARRKQRLAIALRQSDNCRRVVAFFLLLDAAKL
jgi:hypothetical protein